MAIIAYGRAQPGSGLSDIHRSPAESVEQQHRRGVGCGQQYSDDDETQTPRMLSGTSTPAVQGNTDMGYIVP
jgi:hypothetical protein